MNEGQKWDQGKLPYNLIPPLPMEELCVAYTVGQKYGDWNWLQGLKYSRVIGGIFRHLYAWIRGQKRCPKDGQHHLAAVAWACFTLMQFEHTRPEFDDRPPETLDLKEN